MSAYELLIDGELVPAAAGETFPSFEPATGRRLAEVARAGAEDVERAARAARRAFDDGPWPRLGAGERAALLRRVAARLERELDRLAELEARDSGGTIRKARLADLPATIATFEWCAWWAERLPDTQPHDGLAEHLHWQPMGVTAGIVPWNFPLLMAAWKLAPSIAAGNTCVVKPASFTSLTALELGRITAECDLPPGVVNVLSGPGATVGEELVRSPLVDLAAFTGSNEVGGQALAAAGVGKPVRLDLGGKCANVVLDDADLGLAAAGVLLAAFYHNGQVCMAGSRALVHRAVYDDLLELLAERVGELELGDPLAAATDLGPLVSRQHARTVQRYVAVGLEQGARVLCGGGRPEPGALPEGLDPRAFFQPTVLTDVDPAAVVAQEEIFGPVLAVIPVESDEHAVTVANGTPYSLAGGVWSRDQARAQALAHRMRADRVWVNSYHMVDSTRPPPGRQDADLHWARATNPLDEFRRRQHVSVGPQGAQAREDLLVLGASP